MAADETTSLLAIDSRAPVRPLTTPAETRRSAVNCVLATFFFYVWSKSVDADRIPGNHFRRRAHTVDLAGLLLSLSKVSVAHSPELELMNFGIARAKLLGAFISLIFASSLPAAVRSTWRRPAVLFCSSPTEPASHPTSVWNGTRVFAPRPRARAPLLPLATRARFCHQFLGLAPLVREEHRVDKRAVGESTYSERSCWRAKVCSLLRC